MATRNTHRLPLEYVESSRKLNGLARPPFAFFRDRWPADFITTTRHALAKFILSLSTLEEKKKQKGWKSMKKKKKLSTIKIKRYLEFKDSVIIWVLIRIAQRSCLDETDCIDEGSDARTSRKSDIVPSSLPFRFGAVGERSLTFQHREGGTWRERFNQNGESVWKLVPNFMTYHSAERVRSGRTIVTLKQLQIKVLARFASQGCQPKIWNKSVLSILCNTRLLFYRILLFYSNLEGERGHWVLHQCRLQL